MQQMSFAYIKAVASGADCAVDLETVDRDSVDLTLKWTATAGAIRSPRVEVQVKATYTKCLFEEDLRFRLGAKNYDDLSATNLVLPRILVLVHLPRNIEDWMGHSEEELALKRCAYWVSLHGAAPRRGRSSVVVRIPRVQQFNVAGLHAIYERVSNSLLP